MLFVSPDSHDLLESMYVVKYSKQRLFAPMLLIKQVARHITDACINTVKSHHYSSFFKIVTQLNYNFIIYLNICLMCHLFFSRKIEIVQFASRTRQLFVRLLALVKWANNAGKVEKCAVS